MFFNLSSLVLPNLPFFSPLICLFPTSTCIVDDDLCVVGSAERLHTCTHDAVFVPLQPSQGRRSMSALLDRLFTGDPEAFKPTLKAIMDWRSGCPAYLSFQWLPIRLEGLWLCRSLKTHSNDASESNGSVEFLFAQNTQHCTMQQRPLA